MTELVAAVRPIRRWTLAALSLAVLAGCGGGADGDTVRVRVPRGASLSQVADSLAAKGVIDSPRLFRLYARARGAADEIKFGTYAFPKGAAWSRVLEDLRLGRILTTRFVIPEGWNLRRIAERLAKLTGAPPDSLLALMTDSATVERFGVPGPTLEGYLYPATYTVPVGAPVELVLDRLVSRYQRVWTPERRARADSLGMSEREVVTLASIIEAEAKIPDEMPLISAVYHNRLRIGYPLQADPTVQYALGEHQSRLLYSHIDSVADDPYNTYRHPGLPPGPIACPSARAIDAALAPADVDYLYFVARPDGSHVFTRSLREHNRAKARIRRQRRRSVSQDQ